MAEKNVNTPSPAYDEMEANREIARILLYQGQSGLRAQGTKYLPKYEGEAGAATDVNSQYGSRLSRSFLVNFYKDACVNLVGRIFAQPLIFSEDTPPAILALWGNIDECGTSGDIFVQRVALDSLGQGISHVMVDFPGSPGFENAQQEAEAGLRPRWVHYPAHVVIEALSRIDNGKPMLERARIREATEDLADEPYDYEVVNRVREFVAGRLGPDFEVVNFAQYRIHEETDDHDWIAGPWRGISPPSSASREQQKMFIEPPLVAFYGERQGFFVGRPPLLSLSDLNLQHWQKKSDIDNIERIANVPTLILEGGPGTRENDSRNVEVSAYSLTTLLEGESLHWLEIEGKGVREAKDSLRHLEEHIRLAGREPMVKKATGSELATVRLLDEAQHLTSAQAWAMSCVGSINRCLEWTAGWMGLQSSGSVRIDESVLESLSRPEGFDSVKELFALGALSVEDVLVEAKRYGVLDKDLDVAAAVERVDGSTPLGLTGE